MNRKSAKKIYAACQLLKEAEKASSRTWKQMIQLHRQGLLFLLIKDWLQLFGPAEIEEMTKYLDTAMTRVTEKKP